MSYYLSHIDGTEPIFDNMKFIVEIEPIAFHNTITLSNTNEKLCLHQEIMVEPNKFNPERINVNYENVEYQYMVQRYHHENLKTTIYERIYEHISN